MVHRWVGELTTGCLWDILWGEEKVVVILQVMEDHWRCNLGSICSLVQFIASEHVMILTTGCPNYALYFSHS
jgi:hypothetical protein